jgi:hypothetical protein
VTIVAAADQVRRLVEVLRWDRDPDTAIAPACCPKPVQFGRY